MKNFFKKNWIHFACVAFMIIVCAVYFKPQFEGYGLKQHDVEQFKGAANEIMHFREQTGEEPLWTNSMFGGMPTVQISIKYSGNLINAAFHWFYEVFHQPMGLVLMHMIGFYIMALFLRINPLIGLLGAITFSFASYEIIIIQAGHMTKSAATAMMAPVVGAFIYSYRRRNLLGIALCGILMTLEVSMNHLQVTYYLIYLLVALGIYFFIDFWRKSELKQFFLITAGLLIVYTVSVLVNLGNIQITNDYAKHTIRGKNDVTIQPNGEEVTVASEGLDKDYITQWSYGVGETFTLMSPNVKGGGSFVLGNSQFEDILENSDLPSTTRSALKNYPAYWGEQPFTSGPVYLGAVVILLAFLGLIFLKSRIKWVLFAVTVLAILLSWGKNFMGLTDFFIDYVPGYNKFRTVTIILVIVELCVPLLGVLFLDQLLKDKESIKQKKALLIGSIVGLIVFMGIISAIGLGDGYSSESDQRQLASVEDNYRNQILSMDPAVLMQDYQLDVNNPRQVEEFVKQQAQPVYDNFESLKEVREDIYHASWNRSILFAVFAGGLLLVFLYTNINATLVSLGFVMLVMVDMIPVANDYLGSQEQGNSYKYWEEIGLINFPIRATLADEQIMDMELAANPQLKTVVDEGEKRGVELASAEDLTSTARRNAIDSYKFMALNFATNYRVFDLSGGFQSSRASYFHKSLGGYHGAKLRNINNVMDFHLSRMNNKVYDMLNVKYFIQNSEQGQIARRNPTAMGNVWLVKRVETYETPNDEIRALGTQFKLVNSGQGKLLVNGTIQKETIVYGSEQIQYLITGLDTLNVPLSNGMQEGMEAVFVMDANGKTDLVMPQIFESDTAQSSFLKLVNIKADNEFRPTEEAVMLKSEAKKLKKTAYSGEGSVKMTSYAPNKITYDADLGGDQLVVFSEIYYPNGWKAFVDNKEVNILKVNYLLRGVEVGAGKHKIELVYDLPKYHRANTVSLITSCILLMILGAALYMEIRKPKKTVVE